MGWKWGAVAVMALPAGPALSLPSIALNYRAIGCKKTAKFVLLCVIMSMIVGMVYGWIFVWPSSHDVELVA